jgi:hypothetical protein
VARKIGLGPIHKLKVPPVKQQDLELLLNLYCFGSRSSARGEKIGFVQLFDERLERGEYEDSHKQKEIGQKIKE